MADYSFCAFDAVKDKLINCAAKRRIPENAKTVICFAFPYKVKKEPPQNISRYAAVPDYHTVCGNILSDICGSFKAAYKENRFERFLDNSPIPEVYAAAVSGLGVVGDNGLLITKKYGSYVFLGEIVTDLKVECDNKYAECIHCKRCIKACPVGQDKRACLSNVTQKKGELSKDEALILKKNGLIWGCDICAEVCPLNIDAATTYIDEFKNGYRNRYEKDEDNSGRAYNWRGKEIILRNFDNLYK